MAAGPDGALSFWDICIALISGGALTGSISGLYLTGRKVGKAETNIEDLKMRVKEQEGELTVFIDKSDRRHEANIDAINRVTNAVAAVPSKADFQRLEDLIGRRMSETETQLRVSLAEFKQMLFSASRNDSPRRGE